MIYDFNLLTCQVIRLNDMILYATSLLNKIRLTAYITLKNIFKSFFIINFSNIK